MPNGKTSARSLANAARLWTVLSVLIGSGLALLLYRHTQADVDTVAWRQFSSILASVAATMTGFLAAVTAVFYAVYQAPLMKTLQASGHARRILGHLFAGIAVWLLALLLALAACVPSDAFPAEELAIASIGMTIAGVLLFGPVGLSFWLVLAHINDEPAPKHDHVWDEKTVL